MKYFSFYIPIILFAFLIQSKAQNLESIINFGDLLSLNGNYNIALNEYQRAFFFGGNDIKSQLAYKMADCYFALSEFKLARSYYDSAMYYSERAGLQVDCAFQKVLCYIMEDDFGFAMIKLQDFEVDTSKHLQRRKYLYQGICQFGMGQYDESHQLFLKSIPQKDTLKRIQLEDIYEPRNILKRPKSSTAMIMSGIIPGTGQVYAGDIKDGLNSFLLLGGLVYVATSGLIISPVIIIPFFYKYYIGGIINAKQAAETKRKTNQYNYYTDLIEIILK